MNELGKLSINKKRELEEDRKRWLKGYPKEYYSENDAENEENNSAKCDARQEGQVLITDIYDRESIEIDKLVYLALHYRTIPLWVRRNMAAENENKIIYLTEACERFLTKCKEEGITSFEEYDEKYKIHYRSKEWFERFKKLLTGNSDDLENDGYNFWDNKQDYNYEQEHNKVIKEEYNDIFEKVNKIMLDFSTNS
ncbi:MAG TPA: hypothetical protein PK733_11190 [Clostridiales bacterium]|nr:hypothetical protein [Clostridiales bacterium]